MFMSYAPKTIFKTISFIKFRSTIVHATKSIADYYAERLYDALRGDALIFDNNFIRILVSRSEIDLHNIKEKFDAKYTAHGHNLFTLIEVRI